MNPIQSQNTDGPISPKSEKQKKPDCKISSQRSKIKSHEAEDLGLSHRKVISTKIATVEFNRRGTVEEIDAACDARNAHLWDCISREPGQSGFVYKFRLKDEYDNVTENPGKEERQKVYEEKLKTMFPALEMGADGIMIFVPPKDYAPDKSEPADIVKYKQIILSLGFSYEKTNEGFVVTIPDKDELEARWKVLREQDPNLPSLNLLSSEGIANDLDFIEAYFLSDGVVSEGIEFFHDMISHIYMIISTKLDSKPSLNQEDIKKTLVSRFKHAYIEVLTVENRIDKLNLSKSERKELETQIEIVKTYVGSLIDGITGVAELKEHEDWSVYSAKGLIPIFFEDPRWVKFMKDKFEVEEFTKKILRDAMYKIEAIAAQIKKTRQSENTGG